MFFPCSCSYFFLCRPFFRAPFFLSSSYLSFFCLLLLSFSLFCLFFRLCVFLAHLHSFVDCVRISSYVFLILSTFLSSCLFFVSCFYVSVYLFFPQLHYFLDYVTLLIYFLSFFFLIYRIGFLALFSDHWFIVLCGIVIFSLTN